MVSPSLRALRAFALVAPALAVVPLAHCSDNPVTPPSSVTIGPLGGALASSDYVFEILVPAGALSTNVNFTITAVDAPGSGSLGPAYTIEPAGQTFLAPVVLSYTQQAISFTPYNDPSDYRIASFDSNAWAPLANPTVDPIAGTIDSTTTVTSANAYSVVIPSVGTSCFSAADGCAEDAGACAPTCAPAVPGKCAAFPGSITSACDSDGGPSISVQCCYPSGAPICVTEIEPDGCEHPCQNTPGSTAVSCIPSIGPPVNNTTTGGPPVSTCCYPAGSVIVDGGLIVDGAVGVDAGVDAATDSGTGTDSGTATDSGTGTDTGTETDTGAETDTGTPTDTGAPVDASDDGG
jgi:hypothetical protein